MQNFYKKYDIDRLPPVVILSLKRFKYAKLYKKKIDNIITFPLFDLELKKFVSENSDSSSKYDLFGIIVIYFLLESHWFIIWRTLYSNYKT